MRVTTEGHRFFFRQCQEVGYLYRNRDVLSHELEFPALPDVKFQWEKCFVKESIRCIS